MDEPYLSWQKPFELRWASTFLRPGKASLDLHVGISVLTITREADESWVAHCGCVLGSDPCVGASVTMPTPELARIVGLGLWMALNGATGSSVSATRVLKSPRGRDSLA